jgi:hypothetical protein
MSEHPASPWWKKLLWFVALWAGGVLAVTVAGLLLKWLGAGIF